MLALHEVDVVLARYGRGELDVEQAAALLGDTVAAADRDRAELRDNPDGPGPDAWHVIADARRRIVDERQYAALVEALRPTGQAVRPADGRRSAH